MEKEKEPMVLVVDDDELVRNITVALLKSGGLYARAVGGLGEAVKSINASVPDLVISDLVMPDGSGIDVKNQVKLRSPGTPVIIMTGYSSQEISPEDREEISAVLKKPFEREMFLSVVFNALGIPKAP
jgi:DNA-binding NtrC family response regulator